MEHSRNAADIFLILLLCLIFSMTEIQYSNAAFTGVTQKLLGGPLDGLIGVFGDFNMDKNTDVFVITENGHKIELYMKDGNSSYLLHIQQSATIERSNDTITSVASGDFDGDFQMDVLITTKPNSDPLSVNIATKVYVYWGNVTAMKYGPATLVTDQLSDQPLVMDCNGDMVPDIFGTDMNGKKMFWKTIENDTRKFVEEPLASDESRHLMVPNSNAFLDLSGNFAADLFMVTSGNGSSDVTFEIWSYIAGQENEPNTWQFTKGYSPPPTKPQIVHLGVATFADMNADSFLDHILPVCFNDNCTKGAIYVKFMGPLESDWTTMFSLSQLTYDEKSWGFVPPSVQLTDFTVLPLVARTGDFNLDTLNDILVLVQTGVKGSYQRRIVLLENIGETLQPAWATDPTNDIVSPILATFIDIQRTGQLDIIIVNKTSGVNHEIYLMDNTLAIDAYFVQTEILSGLCKSKCPLKSSSIPYGVAQPGPIVRYDTTSSIGQPQMTGGSQLSQSAYFSLQLPYVLLGLGQNPNFVDTLRVGVPGPTEEGVQSKRVDEWKSVIPNSQLIVIPDPLDNPNDWISKMLIIPGQSVLLTGIVLISTCVVLTLTAAFLHLKERKDDEKEKRQEAHRFHFDAM